ncbi:MAG: hypothetical protein NZ901_02385 [Geminocystis sp.]|nr:hypothetical protein [Geminocystis sp.]HIK38695.1 hypothetical protein [Geminocystis sp. M7585_C2015_104]MCS7147018.1 hypothetical protein [Geminocystis sp.]MCX8077330.1 hypothetical protein [Geminocystis sp.]MDW8115842.1 hypothetical protein [Geminocystis sp.]
MSNGKSKQSHFPLSCLVGILAPTVVMGQLVGHMLMDILENMGRDSEEIFRAQRLPLLKNTTHHPPQRDS